MSDHPSGGFQINLADIYHTLFRQKYKILTLLGLSVAAAAYFYFTMLPSFVSEAKVMIPYITERRNPNPSGRDGNTEKSADAGGYTIINSEIEILTSRDLAEQVADAVGPDKVLGKTKAPTSRAAAGAQIIESLKVQVPLRTTILRITYSHKDPEMAQKVLQQLIQSYLKKHIEIHRGAGIWDEVISRQADATKERLLQTEQELHKLKQKVGMVSLEDAKKTYSEQMNRIRQEVFVSQAELAEYRGSMQSQPPATNAPTNSIAAPDGEKTATYQNLCARLRDLERREMDLLGQYTEENPLLKGVRTQIADVRKKKGDMEKETPGLALTRPVTGPSGAPSGRSWENDLSRTSALESKIKALNAQLDQIRLEALAVENIETAYLELQRKKELEEANYRYFSKCLEESRLEGVVGPNKMSNISVVQAASPPVREPGVRSKIVLGILAGGLIGSVLLAFLIEMFLDQTIKRPADVNRKLRIPLMLWIPEVRRKKSPKPAKTTAPAGRTRTADVPAGLEASLPVPSLAPGGSVEVEPWEDGHDLRSYHEALRDRLVTYFEVRNMTHKPKLVAVTGCSRGSGVSSIASGLAAVLSETGDGSVLLVDMSQEQGAAHQFCRGRLVPSLAEALEKGGNGDENMLHIVSSQNNGDKLPRILPRAFTQLVPRMKASDYDYIIFDLPPVSQTSLSSRIARHMDMTLLVVEAEKDHVDVIKRAATDLLDSKANLGALLNRKRTYVPERLLTND